MNDPDVRQWGAQIDRFFAKRTSAQEREDLLQETWYRLVRLQQQGEPLTAQLVSTVCHGVWVDYLRTQHRRDDNEQPLQDDCGCVEWEQSAILRLDVQSALQHLSPVERELLLRHYVLGETCVELAQALGMSKASVEKRIQRARARLVQYLPDYAGGGDKWQRGSNTCPSPCCGWGFFG